MNILLITPPLTQLNTPYPATAHLKGFLVKHGYNVHQCDLGIELVNRLFTRNQLDKIFTRYFHSDLQKIPKNIQHILAHKQNYLNTIEPVMEFLRGNDPTLATRICNSSFLPRGNRFKDLTDTDWAFGALGFTDQAKYLCTLYIEDITDLIRALECPYFELNRYAEKLSLYMPHFDDMEKALHEPTNTVDQLMLAILEEKIIESKANFIGFSIPFPGNLYGALKCGQYIKETKPDCTVAFGGGYVNTELRQLSDNRIFNFCDYILLDDGEPGILKLLKHLEGNGGKESLVKTFIHDSNGNVTLIGSDAAYHIPPEDKGTPDYSDLPLNQYLSMIEVANPMHKLWSDGQWNKLMMAQGCYWAKCAFCDTSLPYISEYRPIPASITVDRMEAIIKQTHHTGFHFTDEAAPPKILKEISAEILKRNITASWWTNVRFEKAFTAETCQLMSEAGCIAVSGGMELVTERLLKQINKGITLEQAIQAAFHFTNNNIMVHTYLMYGFPGQTVQETIDALELVRQMFNEGLIQSAFWHRYAMTIHSPSGLDPEKFCAKHVPVAKGTFANNEIPFTDGQNLDLDMLGNGLCKATYNYMHGLCLDWPLHRWFEKKVPATSIPKNYVERGMGN
jgi:hypothetical protein